MTTWTAPREQMEDWRGKGLSVTVCYLHLTGAPQGPSKPSATEEQQYGDGFQNGGND